MRQPINFLISGETEVNQFAQIRLILEAKFSDDPLLSCGHYLSVEINETVNALMPGGNKKVTHT